RDAAAPPWQAFFGEQAAEYDGGWPRTQAEAHAFECCIVEWLNRNPAPSPAGQCAWCGHPETEGSVVLPFGAEPWGHTWLHAECWGAWREARRAHAVKALALMGINRPSIDRSPASSNHAGRGAPAGTAMSEAADALRAGNGTPFAQAFAS